MSEQTRQQQWDAISDRVSKDAAPGDLTGDLDRFRETLEDELTPDEVRQLLEGADKSLTSIFGTVGPHRLTDLPLTDPEPVALTERYGDAVAEAARLHADQRRKGTKVPYVSHLLGTSAFLLEQPGVDEDQAIAALLHDAIEDQHDKTSLDDITGRFGPRVARIVADCTDADTDPKPPWRHRKAAYLDHLEEVSHSSLQVSLADKLHNARAIVTDLETQGPLVWTRFNAPPVAQRWYYGRLAEVFSRRLGSTLAQALQRTVERLTANLPEQIADAEDGVRPEWAGTDAVTGAASGLIEAAAEIGIPTSDLVPHAEEAWSSPDGTWWIENTYNGDAERPLTIFVHPLPSAG
jgi:hypothetical protein